MKTTSVLAITALLATPAWSQESDLRVEFPSDFDTSAYGTVATLVQFDALSIVKTGLAKELYNSENLHQVRVTPQLSDEVTKRMNMLLRDPSSADFQDISVSATADDGLIFACGLVNAQNGFGAYIGHQPFFVFFVNPALATDIEGFAYAGTPWGEVCNQMKMNTP